MILPLENTMRRYCASWLAIGLSAGVLSLSPAQAADVPNAASPSVSAVTPKVEAVTAKVVAWRRDFHANPELGNMERRTAGIVAAHLKKLGFDEVRTGIAHTGVVGILKGGRPGGVVALRADMDALPILEATGLPFASKVMQDYAGKKTPVMHACGHDAHTAMLMGAAEILAGMRAEIPGTIMFIFQPAEEGVEGEIAGALLMLQEGVFDKTKPSAIFGLHVEPGPVGQIDVRPNGFLSGATSINIKLTGRQTHGGRPWEGTDIINLTADVVKTLTTLSSRQVNVFETPSVVSVASIQAGNRVNIIPGTAELLGTIRTFDQERMEFLKNMVRDATQRLAANYGATAEVTFQEVARVTANDPALLDKVLPALQAAAGPQGVKTNALFRGAAEDFSYYLAAVPGVYYILGSTPNFTTYAAAPTNHSDKFDIDEAVLPIGVKAHVLTALTYLETIAGK
ncbi:MAG: amidohydrolase [Rhodospirillaceae bacterium]|nr:amidohydrolase [Rhodospirillaceae bacterium]